MAIDVVADIDWRVRKRDFWVMVPGLIGWMNEEAAVLVGNDRWVSRTGMKRALQQVRNLDSGSWIIFTFGSSLERRLYSMTLESPRTFNLSSSKIETSADA